MGGSHALWRVGRSPPRRLLLVALPSVHALPSLPERHRQLGKIFSSGWFWQVWREEAICGSAWASSGSSCCQGVAFDQWFNRRYLQKD